MKVKSNMFLKMAAYFMLVIFCVVQTAEVLHHHNDVAVTRSVKADPISKHTAVKGICSICSLIAQQSHHDRNYTVGINFAKVAVHNFHFSPSVVTPTFSGFKKHSGNKGPPQQTA